MFADYGRLLEKIVDDCIAPIDVAHYILMALSVRDETGPTFALQHPFASWFCTLLVSFSGTFLTNFMLGDSLLVPLMSQSDIMLFTVIWYHISILDSFAGICNWKPVKNVLCVAKEFQRNHKVMLGVAAGGARFPDHAALAVLVGCAKGNGSGIVKIVQQFVYGKWAPVENELLKPSSTTKATILAALLYATTQISHEVAYLCGACVLVGGKVLQLAGVDKSPVDQPYDRLRFTLIEAPRMIESLIVGSSLTTTSDEPVKEEQIPLTKMTASEPEVTPESAKECSPSPPPSPTLDQWQHQVTQSLDEIAALGRSHGKDLEGVRRAVGDLDQGEIQTQILAELRELKGLILAANPSPRNPSPDSSTVLLGAPEDTVDED